MSKKTKIITFATTEENNAKIKEMAQEKSWTISEEHAPRDCTDLIAPKIDKKCVTTKKQKSRRRSLCDFCARPGAAQRRTQERPARDTKREKLQDRRKYGIRTTPGPSRYALVLDRYGMEGQIKNPPDRGACASQRA